MKHGKIEHVGKYRQSSRGLYELLQEYVKAGCKVCLEGKEALPDEITTACLCEDVNYMMDFDSSDDGTGRISRIDFTRIREDEELSICRGKSPKKPHRKVAALPGISSIGS